MDAIHFRRLPRFSAFSFWRMQVLDRPLPEPKTLPRLGTTGSVAPAMRQSGRRCPPLKIKKELHDDAPPKLIPRPLVNRKLVPNPNFRLCIPDPRKAPIKPRHTE